MTESLISNRSPKVIRVFALLLAGAITLFAGSQSLQAQGSPPPKTSWSTVNPPSCVSWTAHNTMQYDNAKMKVFGRFTITHTQSGQTDDFGYDFDTGLIIEPGQSKTFSCFGSLTVPSNALPQGWVVSAEHGYTPYLAEVVALQDGSWMESGYLFVPGKTSYDDQNEVITYNMDGDSYSTSTFTAVLWFCFGPYDIRNGNDQFVYAYSVHVSAQHVANYGNDPEACDDGSEFECPYGGCPPPEEPYPCPYPGGCE